MKIATICENRIFSRAYSKGKKCAGRYTVVYALFNNSKKFRIGLTVTKARGSAVVRNRIKRVIRHACYEVFEKYGMPSGCDLIIVARDACAFVKSSKAAEDMEKSLLRLGVISEIKKTDALNADDGSQEICENENANGNVESLKILSE